MRFSAHGFIIFTQNCAHRVQKDQIGDTVIYSCRIICATGRDSDGDSSSAVRKKINFSKVLLRGNFPYQHGNRAKTTATRQFQPRGSHFDND
jgi:hypothetical protein